MKKVKTREEWVDRYAESALISAIRLRRYWLSQGDSEDAAIEKAVKQSCGMMTSSGAPLERLLELFNELASASKAFSNLLANVISEENATVEARNRIEAMR